MDTRTTPVPTRGPSRMGLVRNYLAILISVGLGVGLSVTLFFAVSGWERARLEAVFREQAEVRATAIRQRVSMSLEALSGVGALYAFSPDVDRQAVFLLASHVRAHYPEIDAIAWVPGMADSEVRFPIDAAEPEAGNPSPMAGDGLSHPSRLAMEQAWDSGKAVTTGRIPLPQASAGQFGVQAVVPVSRRGPAPERVAPGQEELLGFVTATFRVGDLVKLSLIGLKPGLVDLLLADESAAPDDRVLYQQEARTRLPRTPFTWMTTFDVGGRLWSVHAAPTRQFFAMYRTWLPWGVLGAGLLLTGLLINILFNALRRSAQVERQVTRRTTELTAEVAERQRAEAALTTSEVRYRRLFETAKDGILILDGNTGLVTDVNPFLVDMLGYALEEIVGKRLWEIGPFKDIARSKVAFDELQAKEYIRYEDLPLQTKSGRPMDVEFVSNIYQVDGKRVIQCNIRDITARKRAEEALQVAHAELERKVQERTGELSSANSHLQASYEQVRRLALRLQSIREDERSGIARELHDELGQALTALKMDLLWASGKLPPEQGPLPERMVAMVSLVDRMVNTVQQVSSTLRPGILDDFGLLEAIRWQGREFQARTGVSCRTGIEPDHLELDPDHVTSLFRILQEALTNVARHARATEVTVRLIVSGGRLILEIADNGQGIAAAQIHKPTSLGLTGMRERALLLNGRVTVTGAPGQGTTVRVEMPYPSAVEAAA